MASKTEQRKIQIIADGSSVNSSMEQMAKATRLMWQELNKLPATSADFAEKSKRFQEVDKRLQDTRKSAKNAQQSLKEMIDQAVQASPLGGIINTFTAAMTKTNTVIKAVTATTHLWKVAIASTGIGLIVIALGSLISYLTSTQAGIDKVNKVLTPMRVIFEKLQGVVQNLGGNLFKGLGELLNGNLKEGFTTLKDGAAQAGDELGKAFTEGIKEGGKLADLNIKIDEGEIELIKNRQRYAEEYKKAAEIAENVAASSEERAAAAQRGIEVTNQRLKEEQALLDMKIEKLSLEQSFNDTSREGEKEMAELIAQRSELETQASEARTTARSKFNVANQAIAAEEKKQHQDAANRLKEQQKKEEEAVKKTIELRRQFEQAERDLIQSLEDIRVQAMEDGFEKEKAKLDLQFERDLAALEAKKKAILDNEVVTQEEKIAIEEQFAELARMKAIERDEAVKEAQAEQRKVDLEEKFEQFEKNEEVELLLMEQSFVNAVDAEMRKKDALLQIRRETEIEKMALLDKSNEEEYLQYLRLQKNVADIDKEIADNKINEAQRAEDYKRQIEAAGMEATRGFLQLGLDLLEENTKARKTVAIAMKAFEIGMVVTQGIREIQGYWASNAGIPIIGPGLATALSIAAGVRTLGAVNKIRTAKYADGGLTGSGKVIDMMMGRKGTWQMPNGQSARNVGSFAKGGHVGSASLGVIGEAGSEWVGPNWMMRSPKYANIFGYLEAERRKATPFATGGMTASAPAQIPQNSSATADLQQFMVLIEQFGEMQMVLEDIRNLLGEWPTKLRVVNDPRDILDGVRVLNEIEADSRINR